MGDNSRTTLVVDMQGFMLNRKQFVVKEFAAYDGVKVSHILFKPPFEEIHLSEDERKQNRWLERNYHGLNWKDGSTDYNELSKIIKKLIYSHQLVYLKGSMKINFFKSFLNGSENGHGDDRNGWQQTDSTAAVIEEYPEHDQPSLRQFCGKPKCFHHNYTFSHCALSNVYLLYQYVEY